MQVVEISLESEVNIPNDKIRFVIVHPSLEDKIADTGNGFRFGSQHYRHIQLNLIKKTLPLVKNHPSSENSPTHFLIFPELSVPVEGLQKIEDAMCNDWPINSVVMGGLEYIKGGEFKNLLNNSNNPDETKNIPDNINSLIVNTAFIYTKTLNNEVKKYYQAKMSGSPPEQGLQNQYIGSHQFLFHTTNFFFTQIICFDAIAVPVSNNKYLSLANNIVEEFNNKYSDPSRPIRIALFFVPQHNELPNHDSFRNFMKNIFSNTGTNQIIDSILFINTADRVYGNSKKYGKSRFHFSTTKYQETNKDMFQVPKTFSFKKISSIKYAQFREDGPCVHSFEYIPPTATAISSGNYRLPFDSAFMHKINEEGSIGHGKPIDGLWKNVFDFLPYDLPTKDTKNRWTADRCSQMNIKLKQNFKVIRQELIMDGVPINRLKEITDLLFLGYAENSNRGKIENPDFWKNDYEGEGIIDLASGLTIFKILGNVLLQDSCLSKPHTALFINDDTEFYLTFMDNPNGELKQHCLKKKYNEFLNENTTIQWGEIDWTKNTLMLICTGNSTPSDDSIERYKKYFSTSDSEEENALPADLVSNTMGRFTSLKNCGWLYTYSLDKLRGDLERDCSQIIPQWRKKLEPLRS